MSEKSTIVKFLVLFAMLYLFFPGSTNGQSIQAQTGTKAEMPSSSEDIQFRNDVDDITLSGILTIPRSDEPIPMVILIPGDGPQTRDESILVALSNHLVNLGFAVLRTDKRGTGLSSGSLSNTTTRDLAKDIASAVTFLTKDSRVASERIGLIGHSEGALIAAMVASDMPEISFIVLMAYPSVGLEDILHLQRDIRLRDKGASDELITFERQFWAPIFDLIRQDSTEKEFENAAKTLVLSRSDKLLDEYHNLALNDPTIELQESLSELQTPWFRYLLSYEPMTTIEKIQCSIFALFAEKDWQVPPEENRQVITKVLQEGKCQDYSIEVFPGVNHHFQRATTGSPEEYAYLRKSISPLALQRIGDWIYGHK